jgi:hypothetical protein
MRKLEACSKRGRRGAAALNKGKKAIKVARAAADKAMDRLLREKATKGYEEISGVTKPAAVAPAEGTGWGSRATGVGKRVGVAAQLLNAIEVAVRALQGSGPPGACASEVREKRIELEGVDPRELRTPRGREVDGEHLAE